MTGISMLNEMQTWRESDKCQVIIGRGDERAFCAGGDVKRKVPLLSDDQ